MSHFSDDMTWHNEPPFWEVRDGVLICQSGEKTDYWQGTYYGFHRDNGHFLATTHGGEFTATAVFDGRYRELYDQAGMMVRIDDRHWIKCGIEWTDGAAHLSVVVTHSNSDWSAQRLDGLDGPVALRLTRLKDALFVQYRIAESEWHMARLAHWPLDPNEVLVGLAFCSPERRGFEARFHQFEVGPAAVRDIHS